MKKGEEVFIADGARLIGNITLGTKVGIWYNAVLRADTDTITIGDYSNVQDNVTIHETAGFPVTVGRNVTIGHNAVLHGCTIGDDSLIGMGAIILNGAVIGKNCTIAAGAVVTGGSVIPDGSMVMGTPGKIKRELTEEEKDFNRRSGPHYWELAKHILDGEVSVYHDGN